MQQVRTCKLRLGRARKNISRSLAKSTQASPWHTVWVGKRPLVGMAELARLAPSGIREYVKLHAFVEVRRSDEEVVSAL